MEAVMVDTERDGSSPENLKVWSERCAAEPSPCALLESRVARTVQRLARSEDPIGDFLRRMVSLAPYAVFALLPLFAGVLQWTHRSARLRYGAHYVLGLHLHALWFFMLLALALLPEGWTGPVLIGLWIHGIIALHRVYGLGWGSSVVRGALATLLYGLLLTLATSALTLALLLG
jgi:hypothetical protein